MGFAAAPSQMSHGKCHLPTFPFPDRSVGVMQEYGRWWGAAVCSAPVRHTADTTPSQGRMHGSSQPHSLSHAVVGGGVDVLQ
jgi:hypothetical protein